MLSLDHLPLVLPALAAEAVLGYPGWLYRKVGHPVTWMGACIAVLDRHLNRDRWTPRRRRVAGAVALLVLMAVTVATASAIEAALIAMAPWGIAVAVLLASTLLAQRSLHEHVAAVAGAFAEGGLDDARGAVSRIVGRNPNTLDEAGVCRAAIESLAENFSDGVVGPALWLGIGGMPGVASYKAVNTADSMIGHRTPRYEAFGWASARFDDLVNLPASRLSALLLAAAAALTRRASAREAWRAVRRDARHHRSPNAGWPEAAMAGALGLRLAGPRVYGDTRVDDHWMGDGRVEATPEDIERALSLYRTACTLLMALAAALAGGAWLIAR